VGKGNKLQRILRAKYFYFDSGTGNCTKYAYKPLNKRALFCGFCGSVHLYGGTLPAFY
jgi:hypothetical protein